MKLASLLAVVLLAGGCVSRGTYQKQSEALARSLELNRAAIGTVSRLEAENKAFRSVYGDARKVQREAEKGILDGTRVK